MDKIAPLDTDARACRPARFRRISDGISCFSAYFPVMNRQMEPISACIRTLLAFLRLYAEHYDEKAPSALLAFKASIFHRNIGCEKPAPIHANHGLSAAVCVPLNIPHAR
jgi:hypothetical protein